LRQDRGKLRPSVVDHRPVHAAHHPLGKRRRAGDAQLRLEGHRGPLVLLGRVWEKSDRAGALQRGRQRTLVAGARSRDATRKDFAAVAHESTEPRDLLVVDVVDLLDAEAADLSVLALLTSRSAASASAA